MSKWCERRQPVDQAFQMLHGLDCNSEGEGIGAGAAMAFQHLGHFAHGLRDTRKDVAHNADADESGDGQADLGGSTLA